MKINRNILTAALMLAVVATSAMTTSCSGTSGQQNGDSAGAGIDSISAVASDTLDTVDKYRRIWAIRTDSLRRGASRGDAKCINQLGLDRMLANIKEGRGDGLGFDSVTFGYFDRAAKAGDLDAIYMLAGFYYPGKDDAKAKSMMKEWLDKTVPLAEAGDPVAQCRLATHLYNEENRSKEAREWARKSALQNFAEAQNFYANIGPEDEMEHWYEAAARNGDPYSIYRLGKKEEEAGNYAGAIAYYRKASSLDESQTDSHLALADLYYSGKGVKQDYGIAIAWYSYLTETDPRNSIEAARRLSACYRFGRGVEQNEAKADEWLRRAQSLSSEYAPYSEEHERLKAVK